MNFTHKIFFYLGLRLQMLRLNGLKIFDTDIVKLYLCYCKCYFSSQTINFPPHAVNADY